MDASCSHNHGSLQCEKSAYSHWPVAVAVAVAVAAAAADAVVVDRRDVAPVPLANVTLGILGILGTDW